jgi:hypothetical protein
MAKEIEWQTKIIKRLRKEGGYAKKWASTWSVGVPDLIVSHAALKGLVALEVKLMRDWKTNTTRKVELTPKQVHELNLIQAGGGRASVLLVLEHEGNGYINLFQPPAVGDELRITRDWFWMDNFKWRLQSHLLIDFIARKVKKRD